MLLKGRIHIILITIAQSVLIQLDKVGLEDTTKLIKKIGYEKNSF